MSFKLHLILDAIFPTFHTSVKRRKNKFQFLNKMKNTTPQPLNLKWTLPNDKSVK